ncbi:hypothetical protein LOK74_12135 [Brevibacillus humidisoli]|nr:PUA domain-containing protein [Brevibacillus humidisoli]UFJ43164.1 hypothetical protein LOK74_12135 [Brevibacillus humidisoli]
MARVVLTRNRKKRLETGHPWVFQSEIQEVQGDFEPGDIVEVSNHQGHVLGKGYINPQSQIAVRLLTYDPKEQIDLPFLSAGSERRSVIENGL